MKKKRTIVAATLGVAVGTALILTQAGWTETEAYKLEGAWIGKIPGSPVMWSYALSPDPSGKRAAFSGTVHVPLGPSLLVPGLFPDFEYYSPMVGQLAMTGPDTKVGSVVWYGMKKGFPFNQVVFIGMNNAAARMLGPNKAVQTNHLAFYAPSADADHDGLPDPGAVPVLCVPPTVSIETRVPIMPPCTPPPQSDSFTSE